MKTPENEFQALMALSLNTHIGALDKQKLLNAAGNALILYKDPDVLYDCFPGCSIDQLRDSLYAGDVACKVEQTLRFLDKNPQIRVLTLNDEDYPQLLSECADAPILLFYLGSADLNSVHMVSMVGTRKCTQYGADLCEKFTREISHLVPDTVVVSGLAYGIDSHSHRGALNNNLKTIGVLAHGLDNIYPTEHRNLAREMIERGGGLLTEYGPDTTPWQSNFIARNRIVAGLSYATVVVESGIKGGSLITAELCSDYGRECFAFPQNIFSVESAGCNSLISKQMAHLITSGRDFSDIMGWGVPRQMDIFAQSADDRISKLDKSQRLIYEIICKSTNGISLEEISMQCNLPMENLSLKMLELEMQNLIKIGSGARYFIQR
ncbi:MAG: DNA-processing protein DprA [Bacteroidaceae bacterium]|nr:DNA-processing protein DprA [Bacteroidaceae bacterium]